MNKIANTISIMLLILSASSSLALPQPPPGKQWQPIEKLSDEFNNGFDKSKWAKNISTWAGRRPGLFKTQAVTVQNGKLQITAGMLPPNERKNGWSHQGGLVRSLASAKYGYFEAKMKANKTFMSSTFWLFNTRNEGTGCDQRVTELDITEVVGFNSGRKNWIEANMKRMNANTHSRNTSCRNTPVGAKSGKAELGGYAKDRYYTYGAWWKGPNEIIFYLDGKERFRINPPANFNLNMYLRLVVETYDWNPPPAGGGMNSSFQDRTTYYEYVRSYRLINKNGNNNNNNNNTGGTYPCKNTNNNSQQCKQDTGNKGAWCNIWNAQKPKLVCFCGGNGPCKGNVRNSNNQDLSCKNTSDCVNKTGKKDAWCNVWNQYPKNICRCGIRSCN